jgi:polar amino acid transport system substrate-binding protein
MRHLQGRTARRGWTSLLVITLGAVTACGGPPQSALERIRQEGFIRAAYAHEPPYAFMSDAGDVMGESPLALQGALAALPVDSVRWVRMDFDALLPALEEGRVDVVASGLYPTERRARQGAFTASTSCSRAALLFRHGGVAPDGLEAFLASGSGRLAVVRGTVEHEAARLLAAPDGRVLPVPDLPTGVVAVREGRADALAMTEPTLKLSLGVDSDLRWRAYTPSDAIAHLVEGCSALVVREAEVDLLAALNRGIDDFVGSPEHLAGLEPLGLVPPPRAKGQTAQGRTP